MSALVKLTQMVDLAVGSPEPGAMNLNILHSLLHVIVQQMHLDTTQVEFRGDDVDRINAFINAASPNPTVRLSEYLLPVAGEDLDVLHDTPDDPKSTQDKGKKPPASTRVSIDEKLKPEGLPAKSRLPPTPETINVVVVEQFQDDAENTPMPTSASQTASPKYVTSRPKLASSKSGAASMRHIEEAVIGLQNDVHHMKDVMLQPNDELLSSIKTKDGKPVGDMWELLKLAKRIDAAETGITKLTGMIELLARESNVDVDVASIPASLGHHDAHDGKVGKKIDDIEQRLWDIENRLGSTERRMSAASGLLSDKASSKTTAIGGTATPKHPSPVVKDEDFPTFSTVVATPGYVAGVLGGVNLEGLTADEAVLVLRDELARLRQELEEQVERVRDSVALTDAVPISSLLDGVRRVAEMRERLDDVVAMVQQGHKVPARIDQLEAQAKNSNLQLADFDASITPVIQELQQQINRIERELGVIHERMGQTTVSGADVSGVTADGDAQDYGGFGELYGRMQLMQSDMDTVALTTQRLMEEQDEREIHMQALLEQVEVLKTVKADKEVLEDALADKADHNVVNRKVSHDQFEAACDDLSRGLDDALTKLTMQETVWSTALEDIQKEIETKLDKVEISPLKEFVNTKLRLLQERLKMLAALRKETEAAGTKHRLIKDVQCVSCDADVVQRRDDLGQGVASEPLPPTRSMRPYLTYELDAVRRQQRRLPGVSRNMNHMQEAEKQQAARSKYKSDHGSVDHLCNRYCGGSHTVTTPQQRVTRVGHFLTQWGPEVIQMQERAPPTSLSKLPSISEVSPSVQVEEPPVIPSPRSPRISLVPSPPHPSPRGSVLKPKSSLKPSQSQIPPPVEVVVEEVKVGGGSQASVKPEVVASGTKVMTPPKTPTGSPKTSPKGSAPTSPKGSTTASLRESMTGSPRGSATGSPKGSPKGSQKGSPPMTPSSPKLVGSQTGSAPRASIDNDAAKTSSKMSQKGQKKSPKASISSSKRSSLKRSSTSSKKSARPSIQTVEVVADVTGDVDVVPEVMEVAVEVEAMEVEPVEESGAVEEMVVEEPEPEEE